MDVDMEYWASWFWRRAGGRSTHPVDIGYAATCALEVGIRSVAGLTMFTAVDHLRRVGVRCPESVSERKLHGCIAVGPRGATILVEMHDADAQRRFTIAHEVSHYILEVRRHHRRAARRMGRDYVGILYGSREATPTERVDAWLKNVLFSPFAHFIDRTPGGGYGCGQTLEAECVADRLAIEILAPRAELRRAVRANRRLPLSAMINEARRIAEQRFGLPDTVAERYAVGIVWEMRGGRSIAERFGFGDHSSGAQDETDSMRPTIEAKRERNGR